MTFFIPKRFQLLLTVLFVAGLMLPTAALSSVQAASPGYAYKWLLHFDFDAGFDGRLEIEVGFDDGTGAVAQPPLHRQTSPVTCQRVGPVSLIGGVAQFNGGYIQCDLNLLGALENAFLKCNDQYPGCMVSLNDVEKYSYVSMSADMLATSTGVAPILAHEDASFSILVGSSTHVAQTDLREIGATTSSPWNVVPPIGAVHSHSARYFCSVVWDCGIHFNVAGNVEYVDTADEAVQFSLTPTTIYIGRDMAGTLLAPGSALDNVFFDPGNGFPD